MKRFLLLCFTVFFLHFLIIPNDATSEIIGSTRSIDPKIIVKGKTLEASEIQFKTYCSDLRTGEKQPCPFKVSISNAYEESCVGSPDIKCGHNDAKHTPASRSVILANNTAETARILGGLVDAQKPEPSNALPTRMSQPEYEFKYLSGEIAGLISIRKFSAFPPTGYVFVSPPCESESTCSIITPVRTEHCGDRYYCQRFVELPEPVPPTEENMIWWWDGYVRCGKSGNCDVPDNIDPANWLQYDKPYNWSAHPTTNWGQWQFLFNLWRLSNRWYLTFSKPLVINDISLPKGGLLDVDTNWKTPHSSHRKGVDADILAVSVPNSIGRPEGRSDIKWLDLYREFGLLKDSNLKCLEKERDYNHLKFTKSID